MCHVVSSNSYKKPASRQVNTYYWWKEAGVCRQWEKEWQKHRLFPLGFRHKLHHMLLKLKCSQNPGQVGHLRSLNCQMWVLWSDHGWAELQYSCLWITDLTNKHRDKLSQKHLWDFHPVRVKGAKMSSQEGKKEKSSVQLSVDWKLLEINWTQTVRLGKDKQKEQGGRGSLHHQPQNISELTLKESRHPFLEQL